MKILVENSTWNNIGDGWYQFSLFYMLKNIYPHHEIILGEGPIKRAFRLSNKKQLNNALDLLKYQEADIHVFSGPMIPQIIQNYGSVIKEILRKKNNYVLISASGTGLTSSQIQEIGNFLKKYPPLFMSTRDNETYLNFKDYVPNSYNGICTAFLVDLNIKLNTFTLDKPFFISSFYTEMEPDFILKDHSKPTSIENIIVKHKKTKYHLPFKIARHLNFLNSQQSELNGVKIVRTIQNLNTRFNHINFAMPNSFISFNPLTYLEVVKSSEFTISDRVHACAVSLGCGKPARFLFETPRAGIFERLKFDYKKNEGIMYPNMPLLIEEKEKLEDFIKLYI